MITCVNSRIKIITMLRIWSVEVLIVSRPIVWNLKMMMSFILTCGLSCRFVSQLIKKESLIEMFGFEIKDQLELNEILSFCDFHNIEVDIRTKISKTFHTIMHVVVSKRYLHLYSGYIYKRLTYFLCHFFC